jgi:hypothetical protein
VALSIKVTVTSVPFILIRIFMPSVSAQPMSLLELRQCLLPSEICISAQSSCAPVVYVTQVAFSRGRGRFYTV